MFFQQKRINGISLLELMLVLLVIAAIIFTVTRYFTVVNQNLKVTQAEQMINTLVDASAKWLEGKPDLTGIDLQPLADAGLIPQNWATDSDTITPWKSALSIRVASEDPNQLVIFMEDVPAKSCHNLQEKIATQSRSANCTPGTGLVIFWTEFQMQ